VARAGRHYPGVRSRVVKSALPSTRRVRDPFARVAGVNEAMSGFIGVTLEGYNLIEKIGRGGMASVYKALDLVHNRTVAIKILAPQLAMEPDFRARFEREAQVLRGMDHPNVVPILDYGEVDGLTFIVMPFLDVGGLNNRLKQSPITVEDGAHIIGQVASALQYAHDQGVIHRDVKPSNILIDSKFNAWLSDFGFAHVRDATLSLTGSALIGTPAYMAPEIVRGEPVTPLSDQYALGVVLYQICTGSLPFDAETPMAIAIRHVTERLPRPRSVNPSIPPAVEFVLLKALAKEPSHRYASVAEFCSAFREAISPPADPAKKRRILGSTLEGINQHLNRLPLELNLLLRGRRLSRGAVLAAALAILMSFPLAASALKGAMPSDINDEQQTEIAVSTEMPAATPAVLSTGYAPITGNPVSEYYASSAKLETLNAQESKYLEDNLSAPWTTPSPTPTPSTVMMPLGVSFPGGENLDPLPDSGNGSSSQDSQDSDDDSPRVPNGNPNRCKNNPDKPGCE
jgi:serine/threonine protein kinase